MLLIDGMKGLGDNIYQRAFLKSYDTPVYLRTPWPEIYKDLPNVLPVKSDTNLRTQRKNEVKSQLTWYAAKGVTRTINCFYKDHGIFKGLGLALGINHTTMDLPGFGLSPVQGDYFVIRPVTVRREWANQSRNPLPEYIRFAANHIRANGGAVVSVADLQDGEEWAVGEMPEADITFHKGELSVSELMALCQHSRGVIGGIGWIVPATMAMQKPAFIVCGGQGGYNSPEAITDKSVPHKITFAVPDKLCMCKLKDHNCDKRITNYEQQLEQWFADLG